MRSIRPPTALLLATAISPFAAAEVRTYDDGHVTEMPANSEVTVETNVPFCERGLRADIYRPARSAAERLPVVVLWNASRPDLKEHPQYTGWGRLIAGAGLAAIAYEGALATAETDGDAILRWIVEHGAEHGVDPDRLCIWGCSSNVVRSLPKAIEDTTGRVRCAVAYYGAPGEVPTLRGDLPLLVVRAGLDSPALNQRIDALTARAIEQAIPLQLHQYAAGSHGFELIDDTDESRRIVGATLSFMVSHLGDETHGGLIRAALVKDAVAAERAGDLELAISRYGRLIALLPTELEWREKRASAWFYSKHYEEAIDDYQACIDAGFALRAANYNGACAAALLGDKERALDFLEAAFAAGFADRQAMSGDMDLKSLRDELRFRALIHRKEPPSLREDPGGGGQPPTPRP